MNRIIICVIVAFIATTATSFAEDVHLIVLSQKQGTEIEVSVDGNDWETENLERGFNAITYETDADEPQVKMMSYGDITRLNAVQGRSGAWYCVTKVRPPEDGDTVR